MAAECLGLPNLQVVKRQADRGRRFQQECLNMQIKAERESPGGFVSDRTVIDNAVYWCKWHAHASTAARTVEFYDRTRVQAQNYDLIVYVPIEFPPEDDQFRSTNPYYQREVDFLMRMFLQGMEVRSWMTVSGTVEERVRQVVEWVHGGRRRQRVVGNVGRASNMKRHDLRH